MKDGEMVVFTGTTVYSMPLVYIFKERKCYLIAEDSTELLKLAPCWKKLKPYDDVKFYSSIEWAGKDFDIQKLEPMSPID